MDDLREKSFKGHEYYRGKKRSKSSQSGSSASGSGSSASNSGSSVSFSRPFS